jgi:hypothetical protein
MKRSPLFGGMLWVLMGWLIALLECCLPVFDFVGDRRHRLLEGHRETGDSPIILRERAGSPEPA